MRLMVLAAALLAGCATQQYSQPHELTNVELCEAFFYATEDYAAAAGQEATNRGVRCAEYRDAVAQYRRDRDTQRATATLDYLRRNPMAPPDPVKCRSYRVGAEVRTVCQ
jgi:uncharacterized lipoprotein YmbA